MTTEIDLCNQALSATGARVQITAFNEPTIEARQCALHYHTLRKQLLRAAPWGFARLQVELDLLATTPDARVPFPWSQLYAYPPDCLRLRYLLPKPTLQTNSIAPSVGEPLVPTYCYTPTRARRWLLGIDRDPSGTQQRIIMSNVSQAIGVYTTDVVLPELMDDSFQQALVNALAAKLSMPLTGNSGDSTRLEQLTTNAVLAARVADGQETISSVDHTPDWILTRGVVPWNDSYFNDASLPGQWYCGWDNSAWGD